MNKLQQVIAGVRQNLGRLSATQQLLIGSLMTIGVMTLFLVTQYTARPDMVDLIEDDPNLQLVDALRGRGIKASVEGGRVIVPTAQRSRALATLGQAGQLPGDTTILFNNLIARQDWRNSRQQNHQAYVFALQNELARVIGAFDSISEANVVVDDPEPGGLGRATKSPTASVTVWPHYGGALSQDTVDAVARLVAGSLSGLAPGGVQVIDATTGKARRVSDDSSIMATSYIEHVAVVERLYREKLVEALGYIPGVVVTVSAQVDVTRVATSQQSYLPKDQGSVSMAKRTRSTELTESGQALGPAEAGVRSNQTADINAGTGAGGNAMEQLDDETDFETAIGATRTETIDPRGMPTYLAASVNVPESFVFELVSKDLAAAAPDGQDPPTPTAQDLQQRFDTIRQDIESQLRPHLKGRGADGALVDGEVSVVMIPGGMVTTGIQGASSGVGLLAAFTGGGGGIGGMSSLIETVVVAVLALLSLFMMLSMVRKSGKRLELPTAEELVGIPPALQTESDLVGEVAEGDSAMTGIEVTDVDVESTKILEQVNELVATDPEGASRLIRRWVEIED